jgi:hypothetical protein
MAVLVSFAFAGQKNTEMGAERKLKEKIGVGFNSSVGGVAALAGRYWLIDVFGIEGLLGFKIDDREYEYRGRYADIKNKNKYLFDAKILQVLKSYKSLNIFSTASLVLFTGNVTFGKITTGLGLEWFVLDDLSLSAEAGLCFNTGSGVTKLETYTENIPSISIKYCL